LSEATPVIVGVGNVLMGDDGVGPAAVEHLRRSGLARRAELIDAGLAFSEVLCDLTPDRPLIIIDAVRGGGPPGSIYQFALDELDGRTASLGAAVSLHEVSVLPALQMEALAGRKFTDVTVFGVEPGNVAWGEGLSAPIADAVGKLIDAIKQYLDQRSGTFSCQVREACGSDKQ